MTVKIEIAVNVYEELSESSRRELLARMLSGPCNVSELVEATGLKQPNVSNHLARLRSRGLVQANKIGRQVYYSIATKEVEAAVQVVFSQTLEQVPTVRLIDLSKDYAKAAVRGDDAKCDEIVDLALKAQCTMIEIYQDLLGAAMNIVGTWYKVEAVDEAQEHMASEITVRMLAKGAAHFGPRSNAHLSALIGCAPGSWHIIGLRMLADYLRFAGWKVQFLGANVPIQSFVDSARQFKPDMVLINCNSSESIDSSLELVRALNVERGERHKFLIGVGGRVVAQQLTQFKKAGAGFSAQDLKEFAVDYLPEIERIGRSSKSWNDFSKVVVKTDPTVLYALPN